ncbi:unnamed protein product [Didymodactylos carnosus]|uniref:Pyridine nucleotide-disulfide oxidoreductase domain-containing protein 1 n=1 Tax=Didymodactylos carnosus TaxID=1234261 RepID=A0A814F2J2_9BILA|nr:unnamed protein product [Didymodactylos carnosus]CAF0979330.1 unnamed protein product [Didymodactylos carnosus]CAF3718741.1 unnamed protein product [Didymodactylos carnosus]CAF3752010.1 unnamed protein product [Didymodactylos carnosus]
MSNILAFQYVVIGGGISGVTCVETLATFAPEATILLLTGSPLIKAITHYVKLSKFLEEFDISEKPFSYLAEQHSNLTLLNKIVDHLDTDKHTLICTDDTIIKYDKLCICAGAHPKLICDSNPFVLGIRDTETVDSFQKKLLSAKQIVIVGNGGIATELVYEVENCSVIWAVRDEHISTTFFDEAAACFFLDKIQQKKNNQEEKLNEKRTKYETVEITNKPIKMTSSISGGALGPDWAVNRTMKGLGQKTRQIHIEYKVEVKSVLTPDELERRQLISENMFSEHNNWPVYVELTNGKIFGCDLIVSATGVVPNTDMFVKSAPFVIGQDGGLEVDEFMRTSVKDVYAAGDVCTAGWKHAEHWFQMRLWSQARQMGHYAAKCMLAHMSNDDNISMDFCFELFAHVTKFFNMKVVLLGKYHENDMKKYDNLIRVTPGEEYIRVTLKDGRVHGCVFIGDTEMEETFENLILNQMDVSAYGESLLDPDIDIADYFD